MSNQDQNIKQGGGLATGVLLGSMFPILLIGGIAIHELSVDPENTIMRKLLSNAGTSTGEMENQHIQKSVRAEAFQEWLLNWAKAQEERQTIAVAQYHEMQKNTLSLAMEMDRNALATQAELLKDSMGGQKTMTNLGDMACSAGKAFGIFELQAGCAYSKSARDDMTKEIQDKLQQNHTRIFKEMIKDMPTPKEFGIEKVDIDAILGAVNNG